MKILRRNSIHKEFIQHLEKTKKRFHRNRANLPFEDKVNIIVELQKINYEMNKGKEKAHVKKEMIWEL